MKLIKTDRRYKILENLSFGVISPCPGVIFMYELMKIYVKCVWRSSSEIYSK